MSYTPQWRKVPLGASGSSMTSVKLFVPAGGSPQLSAGVWLAPSQVYCAGIGCPSWKASLLSFNWVRVAFSTVVSPFDD